MGLNFLSFLMLPTLLALSLTGVSCKSFSLPARRSADLSKRDLIGHTGNIIFSSANFTDGIFLLLDVAGSSVPVQIDLGSADLYIAGSVSGSDEFAASSSQATISLPFLDPPVQSNVPIKLGVPVAIGGQTSGQSLALDSNFNTELQQDFPGEPAAGVLGFGPSGQSTIVKAVQSGRSPLDQVYVTNASNPFSTILFGGYDESMPTSVDPQFTGFFSVGEPVDLKDMFPDIDGVSDLPDLSQITSQPPIPLSAANGFPVTQFTVNGQNLPLHSTVQNAAENTEIGVLTSTETYSVVPIEIAQAIYASVPGSSLNQGSGVYTVPCNAEINITVTIGSTSILLDPTSVVIQDPTSNNCVGSFRANKAAATPGYDISFGLSFFPNVYILIGYNSISGTTLSDPIIKLLPITDPSSAHDYFSNTRNSSSNNIIFPPIGTGSVGQSNGNNTKVSYTTVTVTHTPTTVVWLDSPTPDTPNTHSDSGSISNNKGSANEKGFEALDALGSSSTPSADTGPKGGLADQLKHCLPAIILGAIVLGLILIGVVIYAAVVRRRSAAAKGSAYKNIHNVEAADYSKALYGNDEESTSKYADPYQDRI